jgi:hypothetical protein
VREGRGKEREARERRQTDRQGKWYSPQKIIKVNVNVFNLSNKVKM